MSAGCWRYHQAGRDPGPAPAELSRRLFAGELLVFRGLEPVRGLVDRAHVIVEEIFGPGSPEEAESRLDAGEFQRCAVRARSLIRDDDVMDRCWRQCLEAIGYALPDLYRDRMRLRVVPSSARVHSRTVGPLKAHRDTWGSGVMAQVNWWLPLYPVHPSRTMLVWPDAYQRPVSNDSAEWDFDALRRDSGHSYPLLPVAREAQPDPGEPVLIHPGELLAFSAAHLHAGAVDDSGLTRFSLDARTVWQPDIDAGHGAPDVDGAAPAPRWEMFTPPSHSQPSVREPGSPEVVP